MPKLVSPLALLWLVLNIVIVIAYSGGMTVLGQENGPLENAQVALLFSAFLMALVKWRDDLSQPFQFLLWGAGLLALSFFLRELDLRRTGLGEWVIFFTSEQGRTWLTVLLWLPFLFFIGRNFRWVMETMQCYMHSLSFWFYVVAAIWLVGGGLFDKNIIETTHKYFMEEILELNGYAFYLYAMARMNQAEATAYCNEHHSDQALS